MVARAKIPSLAASEKTSHPAKKTAKPRKPRPNKGSKTNQSEIERQAKKDRILDLVASGASIRQTSEIMTGQGFKGVSRSSVGELLKEALADGQKELDLKSAEYIMLELEKIKRSELVHLPAFLKETDAKGAEARAKAMKILWDRKDRLTGHDKQRHEHTGKDGAPIETTTEIVTRVILPPPETANPEA